MRSRRKFASSSSITSINEKQRIKYSLRPSIDIITEKLNQDFSFRSSLSSNKSNRSSSTIHESEENELNDTRQRKSVDTLGVPIPPSRSASVATSLFQPRRLGGSNWRQSAIVAPNQMALIPFALPIGNTTNNNNKYRRRSVAVCNSSNELKENLSAIKDLTIPCVLSFSIFFSKNSQVKIQFLSLQSLPSNIHLTQLTIKVKLVPDGKEKSIRIRQHIQNEITFCNENEECFILFSNIPFEKLQDRVLSIAINGKDQSKKNIFIGQTGKINFNQITKFDDECRMDFLQAIEKIKPSSIELLISLKKSDDQHIHVDVQRIKGLKFDQKKREATCYLQIILLDRHRPLTIQKTKCYRLKSSNFVIDEEYDFNILTYTSNNLDRLMLAFNLYSNSNDINQYHCVAHVKLGSPLLCSGSGAVHWQQFKARESFSMWHTLNKEQN